MNEQGEDASVANAANWLRLCFHAFTCNNPACVLEERCTDGKALLAHVLVCNSQGACAVPSCTAVRRLNLHWLRCQDAHCRVCADVWRDLSGHDAADQQQPQFQRQAEPLPPEAPGTPPRNGVATSSESDTVQQRAIHAVGDVLAQSGRGYGQQAEDEDELPIVEFEPRVPGADRAIVQLQEATTFMRYLLYCLMCRNSRDAAARVPGLQFWLTVLLPQNLVHQAGAAAGLVPGVVPGAAALSAGRRLLIHRLTCRNPFCALCTGTCELFCRGQGLRREPPVPNRLSDMDLIVHELSLALGSVNL